MGELIRYCIGVVVVLAIGYFWGWCSGAIRMLGYLQRRGLAMRDKA